MESVYTVGVDEALSSANIPFVSVIIPVYNDTSRLMICLRRLMNQSYPRQSREIIVVDNGSEESLLDVQQAYPEVIFLTEPSLGSYAARNRGLLAARGEIIAFTDSDCVPELNWIETGVRALRDHPAAGFVGGAIRVFPEDENRITVAEWHQIMLAFKQERYVTQFRFSATANMLARRRLFEEVGPFRGEMKSSGDYEWGQRASRAGSPPIYEPALVVRHPARRHIWELRQKMRRLAGGLYQVKTMSGTSLLAILGFHMASSRRDITRVWGWNAPLLTRVRVIALESYLRTIVLVETLRVAWGGTPRR